MQPLCAVNPDPDCSIITPTDTIPVADRSRLSQLNPRIMNYCVYMLDGNVGCLGGSATGSAGWGPDLPGFHLSVSGSVSLIPRTMPLLAEQGFQIALHGCSHSK